MSDRAYEVVLWTKNSLHSGTENYKRKSRMPPYAAVVYSLP